MSLLKEQRLPPTDELSPEHTSLIAHEQRIKNVIVEVNLAYVLPFLRTGWINGRRKVIEEGERLLKLEVRRVMEVVSK